MSKFKLLSITTALFTFNLHATEPNLISHWKLDSVENGLIDYAGNNHGSFYGQPNITNGKLDNAVLFDGIDDTVLVPDDDSLDFGRSDFTVSFWFKKLANTRGWDNCPGIQKWNTGGARTTNEWSIGLCTSSSNNAVAFNIETGREIHSVRDLSAKNLNEWYHVAAVREGSYIRLYINAELKHSKYVGNKSINNVGRPLTMATRRSPSGVFSGYSNVIFDDVKIYSVARDQSEIQKEIELDESKKPLGGLISHWKMEEIDGPLKDSIGDNHGTLIGAPELSNGQVNKAVLFDGVDDTVLVKDNKTLDFSDENFTVSYWYKKLSNTKPNWDSCPGVQKWTNAGIKGQNEWSLALCNATSNNYAAFNIEAGSKFFAVSSEVTNQINTWYHLVGVREGEYIKLYVNGELENSLYIGNVAVNNAGRDLTFGTRQSASGHLSGFSHVIFDEVKLYNRSLTSREIAAEYKLKGRKFEDIISGNGNHSATLNSKFELHSWGRNDWGQLGLGHQINEHTPTKLNFIPLDKISTGIKHSVALSSDGKVYSWGDNQGTRLGIDSIDISTQPLQVTISDVADVSAGTDHTLALKQDGSLWSWGMNSYGQRGTNNTSWLISPVAEVSDIVDMSAGGQHSLAINKQGELWAWGKNTNGELGIGTTTHQSTPARVESLANVVQVEAGDSHSLALDSDGNVWAWGKNLSGQTDPSSSFTNFLTPLQLKTLSNVESIAAGLDHSVALLNDGTVWAWGGNERGQLGTGDYQSFDQPVKVENISAAVAVSAGAYYTLVLTKNGDVYAFGANNFGQLGNDTTLDSPTPVLVLRGLIP